MSTDEIADQPDPPAEPIRPALLFKSITFSDGTTLEVGKNDIVVFVGPNNAGKSAALRELENWIAHSTPGKVIKNGQIEKFGDKDDLRFF